MIHYHTHFGTRAHARKFFNKEDAGSGGVVAEVDAAPPTTPEDVVKPTDVFNLRDVKQEKPDFSSLGKKKEPEAAVPEKKEIPPPKEEKKPEEAAKPPEKEEPEAAPAKEPAKEGAKPESKEKPAEAKKPEKDDLDDIQPIPGSGKKIHNDFDALKAKTREAREAKTKAIEERDTLRKELDELKKNPLPEDAKKELDELRALRAAHLGEKDPVIQKDFEAKWEKSETNLLGFLAKHGLNQKSIDHIKSVGVKQFEGWEEIEKHLGPTSLEATKLRQLRLAFDDIEQERQDKIEAIRKDPNSFYNQKQKSEEDERNSWAEATKGHINSIITADPEFYGEQQIPENATPEQKRAIEAHNAKIGEMAKQAISSFQALYNRDNAATAKIVMEHLRLPYLQAEIKTLKETHAKEVKERDARITELEGIIAKSRKAGRPPVDGTVAAKDKPASTTEGIGGDATTAFSNFFDRRK